MFLSAAKRVGSGATGRWLRPPPVTVSCWLGGGLFAFTPGAKLVTTGELQEAGWANLMGGKRELRVGQLTAGSKV